MVGKTPETSPSTPQSDQVIKNKSARRGWATGGYERRAFNPITEDRSLLPPWKGSTKGDYSNIDYETLSVPAQKIFDYIQGDEGELEWLRQLAEENGSDLDAVLGEISARVEDL